jgi:lipopolysaccharide heptosyltransferase II
MKPREFHPDNVTSILVLRLYFVGDVLLSTPVFEALRNRFPRASISALVKRRATDVLRGNPFVDEIIEYDAVRRYHDPRWLARLARELRMRRFGLAVDLTGDLRSSWLLFAADPGFRVGFNHARLGVLLDRRITYRATGHVVDHLLSSVACIGATIPDPRPRLFPDAEDHRAAEALLSEVGLSTPGTPFVALSPGANWSYRRWPAERFGRLAAVARERLGFPSVVVGGADDSRVADEVVAHSDGAAASLAGRTSLRTLGALSSRASAFVANDSGPLHIAASQGTPVVALFGPNTPERFAPRGAPSRVIWRRYPCSPCDQRRCLRTSDPCMAAIGVEEVADALESLIEEGRPQEVIA